MAEGDRLNDKSGEAFVLNMVFVSLPLRTQQFLDGKKKQKIEIMKPEFYLKLRIADFHITWYYQVITR